MMTRPEAPQSMTKKILLVDDAMMIVMLEKKILAKEGFELITAKDGQEALEKVAAEQPDLVVMDVNMPRLTGLEACARLRQDDATRGLPVILVTTKGAEDDLEAGYRSGCSDYVTKPIDSVELITKVRGLLGL
jgi:CheY-like chemotaxis protein